jgi:hypothetical protein
MRPAAYYQFELGLEVPHSGFFYWEAIEILMSHGKLTEAEASEIEHYWRDYDPGQAPLRPYCLATGDSRDHGRYTIEKFAERQAAIGRWHAWRGRPVLSKNYEEVARQLVEAVRNRDEMCPLIKS